MDNAEKAKNMIKIVIGNFESEIKKNDPANNCLDTAIITNPKLMTKNRAGLSMEEMMGQISELDQELLQEGQELPEEINTALLKAARETYIGGNILEKLSPKRIFCPTREARDLIEKKFADMSLSDQRISKVIKLLAKKTKLLRRARRDVQIKVILRIWLFFHIPLAVGLLGALFSHVLAVFFYW